MSKMVDENLSPCNPTGKTLLVLRKRLGWTQPQLGEFIGVTEQTVRNHEKGRHRLRLELWQYKKLHQLMASVGMTVDDLPDPPK
ncbi:helix-turn-helix transcriptional regulator [Coleofasciculus chthonoplastes]|uniref:helix-turn-helix transcriptional regulator n=1 Tax=Coleofasciculus chthonoplastes TaxID=64178 RepID=UPI004064AB60